MSTMFHLFFSLIVFIDILLLVVYLVGLIDYYMGFEQCYFFPFFFLPSARVGHTTDMPRTKPSIHYCEHVAGRHIVTYARLDLGAADPSDDSATSLVINEKQLYRILCTRIYYCRALTHTLVHNYTHTLLILYTRMYTVQQAASVTILLLSRAMTPGIHPDNHRWRFNDRDDYTWYIILYVYVPGMREPKFGYNLVIIPYTCTGHCICRQIDNSLQQ